MNPPPRTDFVSEPTKSCAAPSSLLRLNLSSIMFRGRAAEKLAPKVPQYTADQFTNCPHENLTDPGRMHIDPFGDLHICQGISIGNVFTSNLKTICDQFDPFTHPIIGVLLDGGPYKLAMKYGAPLSGRFADACHLCYETRKYLRSQFPDILKPDQMYGIIS